MFETTIQDYIGWLIGIPITVFQKKSETPSNQMVLSQPTVWVLTIMKNIEYHANKTTAA